MVSFIKFNWNGAKIASIVKATEGQSARAAAEDLLERANEHVPYEYGTLESTGGVSVDGNTAAVSYTAIYAAKLHQHPEYNFQGKGEGRWLQNAVEADHNRALTAMAKPFRGRFV
jgi:hypothetical protein